MAKPGGTKDSGSSRTIPLAIAGAAAALLCCVPKARRYAVRGRVTLITGSSRGMGLALAEQFGRAGARLVLTARSADDLDRARAMLILRGVVAAGDILTFPCDIRDNERVAHLFQSIEQTWGPVEVLVNNAGIISVGPVESQSLSTYDDAMRTNYYGMLHCTLAALPAMLKKGKGAIVNITSIGGKVAVPHLLPYSASKFAALGFSQGLHAELHSKGVRVTTVVPGLLRTGSPKNALFTGNRAEEFRWFNLSDSLPGLSREAWAAAGRVLRGTESGETELSITPQAALAGRMAQLAPVLFARVLALTNRFVLPAANPAALEPRPGHTADEKDLTALTGAGRTAAARWNQN